MASERNEELTQMIATDGRDVPLLPTAPAGFKVIDVGSWDEFGGFSTHVVAMDAAHGLHRFRTSSSTTVVRRAVPCHGRYLICGTGRDSLLVVAIVPDDAKFVDEVQLEEPVLPVAFQIVDF